MIVSTYDQAREYLESFIRPMLFQKITLRDGEESDPLERMRTLLTLLGNPERCFPSIVVTGSSGKGSTAYLTSHILTTAGYKTGLSISPHLQSITERMQIDGVNAPDEVFIQLVQEIQPYITQMGELPVGEPSYFEILLALAFVYFKHEKVALAVIEVGIEGKYDATNVLDPLAVILTNISLDHTDVLGETTKAIAKESVHAIRRGKSTHTVISAVSQPEIVAILTKRVRDEGIALKLLGKDFTVSLQKEEVQGSTFIFATDDRHYANLHVRLAGKYQVANAALALQAILVLYRSGIVVTENNIRQALSTAQFAGRFETITYQPLTPTRSTLALRHTIILDGAHNIAKMEAFLTSLESLYPENKKIMITTFKKGKHAQEMLALIATVADRLYLTEFNRTIDTAKNASMQIVELERMSNNLPIPVRSYQTAQEALEVASRDADDKTLIIVTGSLYLVGELREYLLGARS